MDPLAGLALTVVFAVVALYTLYWVIRRAVAGGIRDAREQPADPAGRRDDLPEAG